MATVLGLVGPIAAFGLFYLGDRLFHLDHPHLQTMMYLMLSVAGHLTIFQTRTRGPWWSTRPAWILLIAVLGTQVIATLVAVYGAWIVTPLGWPLAGLVWAYAVGWFLLTDPVKLLAYRVLDHFGAGDNPTVADKSQADASAAHDASAPIRPKGLNSRPKPETAPAFEANTIGAEAVEAKPAKFVAFPPRAAE